MSGVPRITGGGSSKETKLPKRPELSNPNIVSELPTRKVINVVASIKDIDPLARVTKKFQVAGVPTLSFEVSEYIGGIEWTGDFSIKKQRQAFQTYLHEFMHMALWDDTTISHSPDETSILYYYVKGDVIEPNQWDLKVIKESANRIGNILIDSSQLKDNTWIQFTSKTWNSYVGREFYKTNI